MPASQQLSRSQTLPARVAAPCLFLDDIQNTQDCFDRNQQNATGHTWKFIFFQFVCVAFRPEQISLLACQKLIRCLLKNLLRTVAAVSTA